MADSAIAITPGVGTNIDTYQVTGGDHRQRVILEDYGGCRARFTSYRVPGRAGTTGQNIAAIWNAAGSTVNVNLGFIGVDCVQTAVIAATVIPPIIRVIRMTSTIPTNGTAGFKILENTSLTSNASVTTYQDASADGTGSGTTLTIAGTVTAAAGITQEFAPRLITAVGYEPADRVEFLNAGPVVLRPGEGVAVRLEYTTTTANPTTTSWVTTMRWEEVTP